MTFAPFVGAGACTGRAQPGALALMKYITTERRDGARNWGIYNCRRIAGVTTRSIHGEGRALDIGFALVGGRANPAGTRLVRALIARAGRLGIQTIIWNRTIYSRRYPAGVRYRGVHPHYDHVHVELSWNSARGLTLAGARAAFGVHAPVAVRPNATKLLEAHRAGLRGTWINLAEVRSLQAKLTQKGHRTTVDGKYGAGTRASVLAYQRRFSVLANDGIAGSKTVTHLWS
jgi:hypothetical protein